MNLCRKCYETVAWKEGNGWVNMRRTAALLAVATTIGSCFAGSPAPSALGPARAFAAEGVEPMGTAWGKAIAAAAEKHSGLEVYRTMVQQKSTDVTAAIDRSRSGLLQTGGEDATLAADLAKLSRLASANQQLSGAREDLKLAARGAEKDAATMTAAHAVAVLKADIARELEKQLAEARDGVAARERFGLADKDELKLAEAKYAKAREDAASARKAMDDAARKLEESFGGAGLTKFRAADLFLDVRVDTAGVDALLRAALEADPTLRKLQSARGLEEQKYAFALQLYRSFFGAESLRPLESTLQLRPVDYKLTLSVYNVFLAEVKRKDAARPFFEKLLFPPKEQYLGEDPYALPASMLAYATAATLAREHAKALENQVNAFYLAATMEETAMRQAIRAEADALAALQAATAQRKAGLAEGDALVAAQEAYAKARVDAAEKKGAYFNAVMELHFATGGAFAKRLSGDATAPVGKPPAKPGEAGAEAADGQPLVAYDPAMEADLAAAAERLQAQVEAAAADAAGEAGTPGGAGPTDGTDTPGGAGTADGAGTAGNGAGPTDGTDTPGGAGTADGAGTAGSGAGPTDGTNTPGGAGPADGTNTPGGAGPADGTGTHGGTGANGGGDGASEEEEVDVTALLLTEFDQLTEAVELAKAAGAADVAAAMEEKLAAATAAILESLGLPASPDGPGAAGAPGTPEERAAKTEELAAFLPYLELGLFPALEAKLLAGWAEDAKSAYTEAELHAFAAAAPWTTPDGQSAEPLPPEAIAFAASPVKLTAAPALVGTTAYVPVRAYAEALGYKVAWDDETSTATLKRADGDISVRVGATEIVGAASGGELPTATYMTNGQTFVPLAFFEIALGLRTVWSDSLRQGVIFGEADAPAERRESRT